MEELTEWLGGLRGSRVSVRVPQRGDKRALAETVTRNAAEALAQHRLKRASDLTARSAALTELADTAGHGHPAAADRVHRHLARAGHGRGGVPGGVRGRAAQAQRLPALRDPGPAGRRRGVDRRGQSAGGSPTGRARSAEEAYDAIDSKDPKDSKDCRELRSGVDAPGAPGRRRNRGDTRPPRGRRRRRLARPPGGARPAARASTRRPAGRGASPTRRNCWWSTAARPR